MKTITLTLEQVKEALRPVVEKDGAKIKRIEPDYTWSDTPASGDYQYLSGFKIELEE